MKKTVTIAGKDFEIRPLTWGEVKGLKADGYNLSALNAGADNDDLVERVIDLSIGSLDALTGLDVYQVYELFGKIHELTYVGDKASKN